MSVIQWIVFALSMLCVDGFYIPGEPPRSFKEAEEVKLFVNSISSIHTQISKPYYRLPFCLPERGPMLMNQNMGEFLTGNWIETSPYQIQMKVDVYCQVLCSRRVSNSEYEVFNHHIQHGYHNNWIVDTLPSASVVMDAATEELWRHYSGGFPIGFVDVWSKKEPYIHNHVNIYLDYHMDVWGNNRIVGFKVEPMSIKHSFENENELDLGDQAKPTTCTNGQHMRRGLIVANQRLVVDETITFTYDVIWRASDVTWASRWDIYLSEDNLVPAEVHWYPIANAILFIIFLSLILAMVLVRHLRKEKEASMSTPLLVESNHTDSACSEEKPSDDMDNDTQQAYPMLLSVCAGSGFQLFLCSLLVTILSALGLLNPSRRGLLLQSFLLFYMIFGFINGYASSRLYKAFGGEQKNLCTLAAAFGASGAAFLVFLVLNTMSIFYSSAATPFASVILLTLMWGVSAAMVFAGAHIGYNQDSISVPTISRVDTKGKHPTPLLNISRSKIIALLLIAAVLVFFLMMASNHWTDYILGLCLIAFMIFLSICATFRRLPRWVRVLSAGVLPFVVIYVELFFVLTNMWMNQYYYVYEYTLMNYLALLVVIAEVTVLLVYNELCSGTARVWWLSFLAGATTGLYTFIYSVFWFRNIEPADMIVTYAMYFGYMLLFCSAITLVAGSVSLLAALCFVRTIVGAQTKDTQTEEVVDK